MCDQPVNLFISFVFTAIHAFSICISAPQQFFGCQNQTVPNIRQIDYIRKRVLKVLLNYLNAFHGGLDTQCCVYLVESSELQFAGGDCKSRIMQKVHPAGCGKRTGVPVFGV
jgi:hypothetical protein